MQGIDHEAVAAGDFLQHPSRLEQHLVRGPVLHVERHGIRPRGDRDTRHLVQTLIQRAAVGDIHLLKSAADREHRQAGGDRPRNQRKRRSIPIWIM